MSERARWHFLVLIGTAIWMHGESAETAATVFGFGLCTIAVYWCLVWIEHLMRRLRWID